MICRSLLFASLMVLSGCVNGTENNAEQQPSGDWEFQFTPGLESGRVPYNETYKFEDSSKVRFEFSLFDSLSIYYEGTWIFIGDTIKISKRTCYSIDSTSASVQSACPLPYSEDDTTLIWENKGIYDLNADDKGKRSYKKVVVK